MKRFTGKLSDYRDCKAKVMRHWCEPILNFNDFDITKEKEKRSMKKRMISLILCFTIGLTCTVWMAPNAAAESQQLTWEDIMQEKVTRYDQDVFIVTDSAEEIAEKQEEMEELIQKKMEVEGTEYLIQQQTEGIETEEQLSLMSTTIGEDADWDCPYTESGIFGGYTLISPTERLSIQVTPNTNVNEIVNEAQTKMLAACRSNKNPKGVFRILPTRLQSATNQFIGPACHALSITGYSLPREYFQETAGGYYTTKAGRTKIIFRYQIYEEVDIYIDPITGYQEAVIEIYDIYMPMDVIISYQAQDALYDPWEVDGEIQDWFFESCKDLMEGDLLWDTIENYQQVDEIDFCFDFAGYANIALTSNNTYENSHGGAKKIPPCISSVIVYNLSIDFSDCELEGLIPDEFNDIGCGTDFQIDLSNNRFVGEIPLPSLYTNLSLNLSNNQFTLLGNEKADRGSVTTINVSNNFISEEEFEKIPDYVVCNGQEQQYNLSLKKPNSSIEILPGMLVTTDFMKEQVQVTLNGVAQSWDVASELIFDMEPNAALLTLLSGDAETGYTLKKEGMGAIWLGFTHDKYGTQFNKSNTLGISNVPVVVTGKTVTDTIRRYVTEGEILQVVVSGGNLQNILTKTFTITYNASDLELLDAYAPTLLADTAIGMVPGSNMAITEITPGTLKFTLTPTMGTYTYWNGVATVLKFRAKRSITTTIALS